MPPTATVADNIRAELARARITQTELAKALNLSQQAISAKLGGRTEFSVPQLLATAEILGVPAGYLLGESTVGAA